MTETISSAANPVVKRIRLLADRKYRRRENAFVVEGIQPVWRAVEAGWAVEVLVVSQELLTDSPALRLVEQQRQRGTRIVQLSRDLFERLSQRDGPSGLAAIVRSPDLDLGRLTVTPSSVFAVLHRVSNPGNLGTIIRTVDAVGAEGVILVEDTADPFAPAAVKASMGSVFGVQLAAVRQVEDFLAWAGAQRLSVVATSGYATAAHWDTEYRLPAAVLLGNEGEGLPDDLLARADAQVRIPMVGTAESLNLAVAAAVMLYEVRRPALG